jgi:hypothetical protein
MLKMESGRFNKFVELGSVRSKLIATLRGSGSGSWVTATPTDLGTRPTVFPKPQRRVRVPRRHGMDERTCRKMAL